MPEGPIGDWRGGAQGLGVLAGAAFTPEASADAQRRLCRRLSRPRSGGGSRRVGAGGEGAWQVTSAVGPPDVRRLVVRVCRRGGWPIELPAGFSCNDPSPHLCQKEATRTRAWQTIPET